MTLEEYKMNMEILAILILVYIFTFYMFYLLIRNDKVLNLRINIIYLELCNKITIGKYSKRYSYSKMLFSFKPLKLKYWFTEEEIKELLGDEYEKL